MTLTETPPTRRRSPRSVSTPALADPVEQLDQVVEACHRVNRTVPRRVLDREELIALGGLLTQVSAALLRLTDLLAVPTASCDRARRNRPDGHGVLPATPALDHCRASYGAAHRAARAMHSNLKLRPDAKG